MIELKMQFGICLFSDYAVTFEIAKTQKPG